MKDWKDLRKGKWIILGVILYTLLYFLFYPKIFLIIDEQVYSQHAQDFLDRALKHNINDTGHYLIINGEYAASKYPPGHAMVLAPLLFFGFAFQFLLGYLSHLGTFLFVLYFLKRYRLPKLYSFFFLFNPMFVLLSYYIYSDSSTMFFFTGGAYFFLKIFDEARDKNTWAILSGIFFSITLLIRTQTIILLTPLLFYGIYQIYNSTAKEKKFFLIKQGIIFALPIILGIIFLSIYNNYLFSSPTTVGYSYLGDHFVFSFHNIFSKIVIHLLFLFFLVPGASILLFIHRKEKKNTNHKSEMMTEILLFKILCLLNIIFYSTTIPSALKITLGGFFRNARIMLVVIPLALIIFAYHTQKIYSCEKKWVKKLLNRILVVIGIIYLLGSLGAGIVHDHSSETRFTISEHLYTHTPEGAKIILSDEGSTIYHTRLGKRNILPLSRTTLKQDGYDFRFIVEDWDSCYYVESGRLNAQKNDRKIFREQNSLELRYNHTFYGGKSIYRSGPYGITIYYVEDCTYPGELA